MKAVIRLEVLPSITSIVHTDSINGSWVVWTLWNPLRYIMAKKEPKMCKQGTAG
jgi:hypothetical protein